MFSSRLMSFSSRRLLWRRNFATSVSVSKAEALAYRLVGGDRRALSQAITLVESSHPQHRKEAEKMLSFVSSLSRRQDSFRIGLSGSPGVGKSSFLESLGSFLTSEGCKVAVLVSVYRSGNMKRVFWGG